MKRSSRTNRFGLGRGLRSLLGKRKDPLKLSQSAGAADHTFEALEQRQLLFTLTIGSAGQNLEADFSYFIPYLAATSQPTATQPTVTPEDFNQARLGPVQNHSVLVTDTGTFVQSRLRIDYTTAVAPSIVIDGQPPQERGLNIVIASGESVMFSIQPSDRFTGLLERAGMRRFLWTILSGNFIPNSLTVDLMYAGSVTQSFTGNALLNQSVTGSYIFPNANGALASITAPSQAFDAVRITANTGAPAMSFVMDPAQIVTQADPFAGILGGRMTSARVAFSGPAGATIQFLDLYDRDIRTQPPASIAPFPPGAPQESNIELWLGDIGVGDVIRGDRNMDGVPDFNDGIGRVLINGVDATSAFTMIGGSAALSQSTGVVTFTIVNSVLGKYDDFEAAGMGYAVHVQGTQIQTKGLPPGPGSVIVGAPFTRPQGSGYNPAGIAQGPLNFSNANQGIFVTGGSIAAVYVHGLVYGFSQFSGSIDRFITGSFMGSANIQGDLGTFMVGSDAGMWVDDFNGNGPFDTASHLNVGRTVGEIDIAGRSLMNVTVTGDLTRPALHPPRDVYRVFENEYAQLAFKPQQPSVAAALQRVLDANNQYNRNAQLAALGDFFGRVDQALVFGSGFYRNDTIDSAQWVGSAATAVEIHGDLGGGDDVNTAEDPSDVYGFAVDGSRDIDVELSATAFGGLIGTYMRLVDSDGRTVAAPQLSPRFADAVTLKYHPNAPGAYYLVLTGRGINAAPNTILAESYVVTISGIAPTTLGAYRTGAGQGNNNGTPNVINILSGSMGSMRVGTAFVGGDGTETDPTVIFNPITGQNLDTASSWQASTLNVAGSLYNIFCGGDVGDTPIGPVVFLNVGGNLGSMYTGMSPVIGTGFQQGDLESMSFSISGSIGTLDIRGGVGIEQDGVMIGNLSSDAPNTVVIRTGLSSSLNGDIGMFRIGSHVGGDTLNIHTAANSTIGALLVDQDSGEQGANAGVASILGQGNGIRLNTGFNSDLKFFDTPQIDYQNLDNKFIQLIPGVPQIIADDGGGQITITINGGDATTTGLIRVTPVDFSQGVAIGRIEVNLSGDATLDISGVSPADPTNVIGIGRIVVTGSTVNSAINLTGDTQIDVWQIQQTGGTDFGGITNSTPNGDIVAIDMAALNTLDIQHGNLGRTQLPAWGPQLIGPFLGIGGTGGAGAGAPINVPAAVIIGPWNGQLYRPINNANRLVTFLDDVGSPVDPYLNGLIVRTGNITSVTAGKAIGDVIDNDVAGTIFNVVANSDSSSSPGGFDGIVGNIYGQRIASVDVGDGMAMRDFAPLATTGITANDDIGRVFSTEPTANISSNIIASNSVIGNQDGAFPTDGVDSVALAGGSFIDAYIGGTGLDGFWTSFFSFDGEVFASVVNSVTTTNPTTGTGTGGNFFRSQLSAITLNNLTLSGFYDASLISTRADANHIEAQGYRNSTITGRDLEFRVSQIFIGSNLGTLTTTLQHGDIEDQTIDVLGRITEVSAFNISRVKLDADAGIDKIKTDGSIRGSSVTAGVLSDVDVQDSINASDFIASGPIVKLEAKNSIINTNISVTGPDGRIGSIKSKLIFSGTISSAGPIDTVEVTDGDLIVSIQTTTNLRGVAGDINELKAGRDVDIATDVSGNIGKITAGRNIGNMSRRRVIQIAGTLDTADASGGQLYEDLRVGQTINKVLIGSALNKPGDSNLGTGSIYAFGRIETVTIAGDFGATISSASGGIGVITLNNGSLLPTAFIQVLDGTLNNIVINAGHMFGTVHADYNILSIRLNGSADGMFGDMGVNPNLSPGASYDAFRNQLPPNTVANSTIQGPVITAGFNIGRIILTNGSIFEAFIFAGRAIGTIDVTGDITKDGFTPGQANVIAAGSSINVIHTTGRMDATDILAGIKSFGNDNRPGGLGGDADTVRSGRITTVQIDGAASGVHVSAGLTAGADGQYNTFDELVTPGISYVRSVTVGGILSDVSVFADSPTLTFTPGIVTAGTTFPNQDSELSTGAPVPGGLITPNVSFPFTWGGVSGTILFTGPGTAYWDSVAGRVSLIHTGTNSSITIDATGTLTNFKVVTNDDGSMNLVTINAPLAGRSIVDVDAYCVGIHLADFSGTGFVQAGMNLRTVTVGNFTGGFIRGAYWLKDIVVNGNFGLNTVTDEARIDVLAGDTITINGNDSALINIERDLAELKVTGAMDLAQFRAGSNLGKLTAGSMSQTRVSVNNFLGPVKVTGDVIRSAIQAGGDLGEDAAPGGTGFNADQATSGSIDSVDISGNFIRSDIVAGMLRGPDGYFGTPDDQIAPGRSNIGDVGIDGIADGSNVNSEQFRVSATGTLGDVTFVGEPSSNFKVKTIASQVRNIQILDLQVAMVTDQWQATIIFNQPMNASTIPTALTINEVRDGGATLLPLVLGTDYTIGDFDPQLNAITIFFSRDVTDRDLVAPGVPDPNNPGPGVFRFELSAAALRASIDTARLDGDGDGFAALNENYSQDTIVGDAGDDFTSSIQVINGHRIDIYGAADLDVVLDNNRAPDGLPDPNTTYTIRGVIGDHPDQDGINFTDLQDLDVYKITLQAGQILRLGAMQGAGQFTQRILLNAAGDQQGADSADSLQLAVDPLGEVDLTQQDAFLIKTTGTYFIVVGNTNQFAAPVSGAYNFTVQVFDDGDTGFAASTNSGNGEPVVNAPAVIVFAGPNGVFQSPTDPTYDDLSSVTIGDYRFTLDPGPDGIRGTADDLVTGDNGNGITSTRTGTNFLTSTINSSIGPAGHAGVPGEVTADADIYHLNNGVPITPGTLITVRIKLADLGADLGSFSQLTNTDFRGEVQFAVFDTTGATGLDDALMVFSPTDFKPRSQPQKAIAQSGQMSYGYDANGDFYITFIAPDHLGGAPGQAASFALYLQGAFNTDYTIVTTEQEGATLAAIPQAKQNILIETHGGTVNWLEAGGLITKLLPFASSVLGFTGNVGGLPVDQYILTHLQSTLQSIFTATGLNVVVSTNPADFEFQPFTTIFLTQSNDPTTIISSGTFGYSQHSDPLNMDKNDEGVIFLPSFASLGYTPSQADVDAFVLSLTAAVGRRAGEAMGLRITDVAGPGDNPMDIMAGDSVENIPGAGNSFRFINGSRALSNRWNDAVVDTDFFLGRQNAFALMDKFLTP